jgi:hypothetical protein
VGGLGNERLRVCLVDRSNSEILISTEISLFVSPVGFSGHCPPQTDIVSRPCPLRKSSFSTELGWLHPLKRLERPATGPRALAPRARTLMTHKYRGSQQSSREVLPKFIDSTQGEPKNICKP